MFDRAFFRGPNWSEHIRRYAKENGYESVSVHVTTVLGERLDVQRWGANDEGLRIYTRSGGMIYVPYDRIMHVEVLPPPHDGAVGFQISAASGTDEDSVVE